VLFPLKPLAESASSSGPGGACSSAAGMHWSYWSGASPSPWMGGDVRPMELGSSSPGKCPHHQLRNRGVQGNSIF